MAPGKTIFHYKQGVFHFHVSFRECKPTILFMSAKLRVKLPTCSLVGAAVFRPLLKPQVIDESSSKAYSKSINWKLPRLQT